MDTDLIQMNQDNRDGAALMASVDLLKGGVCSFYVK
jgi:hypothetical protein